MPDPDRADKPGLPPEKTFSLLQLVPNLLTIAAICAGLSSIRFGVQGNYILAVQLIVLACVLDGMDGRVARLLSSDSKIGAELDSLADFLNFGVAPPMVIYFWALQDMRNFAWISVLIYAVCAVMRLARFNVSSKAENEGGSADFFQGVPSPAGALLVMMPMYVSFAFADQALIPDVLICALIVLVGLAMISNIPIWSFKSSRIPRGDVKFFVLAVVIIGAAVLTFAWITLLVLCVCYVGVILWCMMANPPELLSKGK